MLLVIIFHVIVLYSLGVWGFDSDFIIFILLRCFLVIKTYVSKKKMSDLW